MEKNTKVTVNLAAAKYAAVCGYDLPRVAGVQTPKIRHYSTMAPSSTTVDEALQPEEYRWFRRDELVRRCIVINAAYATFAAGFETELEAVDTSLSEAEQKALTERFSYVKTYVDQVNQQTNLDQVLFIAAVKRCIYGKAGFEIILESEKGAPKWLLSLQSLSLKPKVDDVSWKLEGFTYTSNTDDFTAEEILYFTNLQLENDYEGLSDVEPILPVCRARHNLLKNDFPEITRSLWAPFAILKADTSGMSDADEDTFLNDAEAAVKAGKSLIFNRSVEGQVVDLNINLTGLVQLMDKLEETIIRAFGTPRFLINKTPENRATAYVEFEAYINGPIASTQRYFKRELEHQWYMRLAKLALQKNGYDGDVPVKVKHVWKTIRATDINEVAAQVAALYGNGLGILAEHADIAFDMMGWDKKKLQTVTQQPQQQQQPNPSPTLQQTSNPQTNKEPLPDQETVKQNGTPSPAET